MRDGVIGIETAWEWIEIGFTCKRFQSKCYVYKLKKSIIKEVKRV